MEVERLLKIVLTLCPEFYLLLGGPLNPASAELAALGLGITSLLFLAGLRQTESLRVFVRYEGKGWENNK